MGPARFRHVGSRSEVACRAARGEDLGTPRPARLLAVSKDSADDPAAAAPGRVFGPDHVEEVELRDGVRVRLRPIRPADKDKLAEGLARLSPQSRYLRFFTDKERLTAAELRYFTEVDGEDHFALGVSTIDEDGGEGQGVGIGRFVRLSGEPTVAEPALAVVDEMHGRGLGRLLMLRLIAAATERGIDTFRCDFLAVNQTMGDLLRDLNPQVEFVADGPVVTAEFRLPTVPADHAPERAAEIGPLFRWFKLVAEQVVEMRQRWESPSEMILDGLRQLQRRFDPARDPEPSEDSDLGDSQD